MEHGKMGMDPACNFSREWSELSGVAGWSSHFYERLSRRMLASNQRAELRTKKPISPNNKHSLDH